MTRAPLTALHGPISYQIVLPPGWRQRPIRPGAAKELSDHVQSILDAAGKSELGPQLRAWTHRAVKDLQDHSGIDMFLPEGEREGGPLPVSLVSASVALGDEGEEAGARAAARLSAGRPVEVVELPTGQGWRWTSESRGRGDQEGLASQNIHCLRVVPEATPPTGLLFSFGILGTDELDEGYLEMLGLLFDALMQSVTWVRA